MDAKRRSLTLAGAALCGLGAAGALVATAAAQAKEKVIKVTAKRFTYSPSQITLKKGVPVVFELKSLDVMMGFNVPDFNVRADIVPDKVTRLRMTPDKTGTFIFLCDVFCGSGHEEMNGKLTVIE